MNPDQQTPKSTATGDIHELRYRISQLEHLIVNNNSSSSSSLGSSQIHHHQNNSLPSNSTQLHTPHGLIQRVNELEGLLAASESQNNVLLRRLDELNAEKNRQEVLLLEKLFYKDREMKDLREDHTLLELRFQKNEVKLENIKEYINGLPCQEELDEARAIISKLEEDNHLLEGKVGRMEQQILNLQKDLLEKEKALSDAQVRMEELKPLEDAQTTLLKERDLKTFNLQDENEVLELLTVQKAQILRSSKLITKLRDKIARLDGEKTEALIKISNKEADIESLQEQYLSMQLQIDKIMSKLQLTEAEKTKLSEKYRNLYEELTSRNAYLQKRDEQLTDLVKLVTEIDLCVNEVGKLVELGQSLANGQEPSVATLLGLSEDLELHMQSLDSGVFNEDKAEDEELLADDSSSSRRIISSRKASTLDPSDSEWVKSRTQKVRELRKNLSHLRDIANDLYTDVLGGNVEGCKVQ